MTAQLQKLEQQLADLQLKKQALRRRLALTLFDKIEKLFAGAQLEFSPELVLGVLAQNVSHTTPADHVKLTEQGAAFFRSSSKTRAQKLSQDKTQSNSDDKS